MAEKTGKTARETLKETIQLERDQIREKIKELIDAQYSRLEKEAERIAPDFDYEAEGRKLKAEEAEELARVDFEWADPEKKAAETEEAPAAEEEVKEGIKKEYGPLPKAKVTPSKYLKPAHVLKSAAGKVLFGDKHRRTLTAAAVMLILFAAYQAWDYLVPKTVHIDYLTFEGMQHMDYSTTARIAGEVMDELVKEGDKNSFSEADLLETGGDVPVKNDLTVGIRHATAASAKIAGSKQTLWLVPGTVEENLELNDIAYDDDDEIKPALDKKVSEDTKITVNEVHYDIEEKKETVEAVDKVILDPSLTSGVQETSEGNDGEGIFT